jgi:hypothetical protein
MMYSVEYLRKGVTRGTSNHRGTTESALASARAGLISRGADSARVLDDAGVEVGQVRREV